MQIPAQNPALVVEIGTVFVLGAALASRVLLSRAGIPSIITLLAFGVAAGPSGLHLLSLDLTNGATRALLQLAVVVVLFEATLRLDLRDVPKRVIALLALVGSALTLFVLPPLLRSFHISHLLASMIAAICIVTGPTVVGPLMARIRPRSDLSRILESEGLVLDAIGVIVASVVFASFTSRPGTPVEAAWAITLRVGTGVIIGLGWGLIGRYVLALTARSSSDLSKIAVLLVGFAAYASADWAAHESGLVAVVLCGLMLDFRTLPHERLVRSFKEDLSMLALSTVFVLLASQIDIQRLGPLVPVAVALTAALFAVRAISVLLSTIGTGLAPAQRLFMMLVFPRGIVAVSLATYYASQIPAWGLHGATQLAGILFLTVILTIVVSTPAAMFVAKKLKLQMPAIALAGITPFTLDEARRYKSTGHLPLLVDVDPRAVSLAHSHDLEAVTLSEPMHPHLLRLIRQRSVTMLVIDPSWETAFDPSNFPASVTWVRSPSPS